MDFFFFFAGGTNGFLPEEPTDRRRDGGQSDRAESLVCVSFSVCVRERKRETMRECIFFWTTYFQFFVFAPVKGFIFDILNLLHFCYSSILSLCVDSTISEQFRAILICRIF